MAASDLIADILHYCVERDLDPVSVIERSWRGFVGDYEEEPRPGDGEYEEHGSSLARRGQLAREPETTPFQYACTRCGEPDIGRTHVHTTHADPGDEHVEPLTCGTCGSTHAEHDEYGARDGCSGWSYEQ